LTWRVFTASQNVGGAARGKAQNKRPACALSAIFAAQPRAPEEPRHRRERSRSNFVRCRRREVKLNPSKHGGFDGP